MDPGDRLLDLARRVAAGEPVEIPSDGEGLDPEVLLGLRRLDAVARAFAALGDHWGRVK